MRYENNKIVYEAGDWVKILSDCPRGAKLITGDVVKVKETENIGNGQRLYFPIYAVHDDNVCPATQEEIDKATQEEKIMVEKYEVRFVSAFPPSSGAYSIRVGCAEVSKELFLKIGKKAKWID